MQLHWISKTLLVLFRVLAGLAIPQGSKQQAAYDKLQADLLRQLQLTVGFSNL